MFSANRKVSPCTLNQMFQVFEFASCVPAIKVNDVKNARGIPFDESSKGASRKSRPHMGGQSRVAHVRLNAPRDTFVNGEIETKMTVFCSPFPGRCDSRYEACDGTGSASFDSRDAFLERNLRAHGNPFVW